MIELRKFVLSHKILLIVIFALLGGGGVLYARNQTPAQPLRYVTVPATKGSLVVALRGSGQVSGQNQLDIKPTVSGAITDLLVKAGDVVKTGQPLFKIDNKTATRAVRDAAQALADARISQQSSELSLQKLKEPADALSILQLQNAVNQADRALTKLQQGPDALDVQQAEADLQTQKDHAKLASDGTTPQVVRDAYDNAVPSLKATAQTFQQIIFDTETVLGTRDGQTKDPYSDNVRDTSALVSATNAYLPAKMSVDRLRADADALQSGGSTRDVDHVVQEAQQTAALLDPYLRSVYSVLLASVPSQARPQATIDSLRGTVESDRSAVASKQTLLTTQVQGFTSAKESYTSSLSLVSKAELALEKLQKPADASDIRSAQEKLDEAKQALVKLQQGPTQIDLLTAQNAIAQRRAAVTAAAEKLSDAQDGLTDYIVLAPFDGVAAKVISQKGDLVSPSTVVATLLTDVKIAQLSLNEVDVAKLKVGQKATLTFDAVPDLSIAGSVYEIDTIGTVSQGVVNYAVKILFQTQDDRVKSGMSVAASVITDLRTDVVLVPNAAVHRVNGNTSVQILANVSSASGSGSAGITSVTPPEDRTVEVGISNDSQTEITQGVNEGEQIVTRTIDPATQVKAATTGTNAAGAGGLRIQGLGGVGGGAGGFTGGTRGGGGAPAGR